MGLEPADIVDFQMNQFVFTGKIILAIDFLIKKVDLKIEEKEIKDYKEACEYMEFVPLLVKIAEHVSKKLTTSSKKKPQ